MERCVNDAIETEDSDAIKTLVQGGHVIDWACIKKGGSGYDGEGNMDFSFDAQVLLRNFVADVLRLLSEAEASGTVEEEDVFHLVQVAIMNAVLRERPMCRRTGRRRRDWPAEGSG